ncbi:DMT family transporter [Maritimibacter alkaliphilus]|uniref:DMT family transporter n=1 Tax=Maritimibacter alkaliphilus TaxID=404236 RepID=UPI001C9808DB|nr:DMT family transporter [Maritimibacter alkaliphilus]MBY6088900.1 DMT family transporter [Maritimibacter alkaliphilus]
MSAVPPEAQGQGRAPAVRGAPSETLRGHLAMLLFSILVAGSFSLGGLAAPHVSALALNAVRFMLAVALLGIAALLTTGLPRSALAAPWRYPLLGGIYSLYFVLMFVGLKTAHPVSASAVFTLMPLMAVVTGWLIMRQVAGPKVLLALMIGALGAIWVIFRGDLSALARLQIGRGEAIYLLGCVAHATYTPMVPWLNRGERPLVFSFWVLLAGAVLVTLVGWGEIRATDWAALPAIVWITIVYTAVFATAITFVLMQYASLRLTAAKVLAYTYLTPTWVILWELALGHGAPPLLSVGGILLSFVAIAMLLRGDRRGV